MTAVTTVQQRPKSVLLDMADRYGMELAAFEQTLRATVVPQNCTKEQFAAFLLVARDYNLNPVTKEIFAFPSRNGGIQPVVSVDGWMSLINRRPEFDGIEFEDRLDNNGHLLAVTCRIYRKDRSHPCEVTEYMSECVRDTDTWRKYPARMLRHKAAIQCARYAFAISGIVEPDEAERAVEIIDTTGEHVPPRPSRRDFYVAQQNSPAQPNPTPTDMDKEYHQAMGEFATVEPDKATIDVDLWVKDAERRLQECSKLGELAQTKTDVDAEGIMMGVTEEAGERLMTAFIARKQSLAGRN